MLTHKPGSVIAGMDVQMLQRCYGIMTTENLLDAECLQSLVSQALSLAIMGGAALLQVPQILNIIKSQSVEGLSGAALYASVVIPITFIAYNVLQGYPLATWGENLFSLAQNIVLLGLYWRLGKPAVSAAHALVVSVAFVLLAVACFHLPVEHQGLLPLSTLPLIVASRVPQIVANYQNGHTGPLSLITFVLVVAGSGARVYTTIVSVGWDLSLIANYGAAGLFSAVLAAQVLYYGGKSKAKGGGKAKKA